MNPATVTYGSLGIAIVLEVIGATCRQKSEQVTRLIPSLMTGLCYAGAFYLLAHTIKTVPVGVAYAIWSGLGIVLISAIAYVLFRQALDVPALIGLGFIVAGVVIVNAFSQSVAH